MIYINININCNELIPCTTTPALTFSTFPTSTPNYNPLLSLHFQPAHPIITLYLIFTLSSSLPFSIFR